MVGKLTFSGNRMTNEPILEKDSSVATIRKSQALQMPKRSSLEKRDVQQTLMTQPATIKDTSQGNKSLIVDTIKSPIAKEKSIKNHDLWVGNLPLDVDISVVTVRD